MSSRVHDQDVRVGIVENVVRAEIGGAVEPEPRRLRQHLPLERDRRDRAVEGAEPVGRDDDAPPVRQVVIVAHLAAVVVRQLRDRRVVEDEIDMAGEEVRIDHWAGSVRWER